jgi:hypothetical protein
MPDGPTGVAALDRSAAFFYDCFDVVIVLPPRPGERPASDEVTACRAPASWLDAPPELRTIYNSGEPVTGYSWQPQAERFVERDPEEDEPPLVFHRCSASDGESCQRVDALTRVRTSCLEAMLLIDDDATDR